MREGMSLFAQDLYGGADPSFRIKTRVYTELAWHSLFIRTLLIRPGAPQSLLISCRSLTIVDLPSVQGRSQTPRRAASENGRGASTSPARSS